MPERPETPRNALQERQLALKQKMAGQHPFHERLADVYEKLGGDDFLQEWAEDNPGQFLNMMMKAAPPPQTNVKGGGLSLTLALHPALAPGPLDITPKDAPVASLTIDHDDD